MSSRTANSKAAASTISDLFQKHYPEFLVRLFLLLPPFQTFPKKNPNPLMPLFSLGAQVFRECARDHDVDILALQAHFIRCDVGQDEGRRHGSTHDREGASSPHRRQR